MSLWRQLSGSELKPGDFVEVKHVNGKEYKKIIQLQTTLDTKLTVSMHKLIERKA